MSSKDQPNNMPYWLAQLWDRIEIKTAIRTGLAAATSMIVGSRLTDFIDRPDRLVSGLWCVVSTIVVMQTFLGGSYRIALNRILGVIVGSLFAGWLASTLGSNALALGVCCFLTIIVCCAFNIKDSIRMGCLTSAVIIILWGLSPTMSPWEFSFFRFVDTVIGVTLGILIVHTIWPEHAIKKMETNISDVLKYVSELFLIVSEITSPDAQKIKKADALIEQTHHLLMQDKEFLDEFKLELLARLANTQDWSKLSSTVETIFKATIALREVYTIDIHTMMDETLLKETKETVELLYQALQEESEILINKQSAQTFLDLHFAIERMNRELLRFRATKTTRQFDIAHVEGFFVYYYQLKVIIEHVQKLQDIVALIFNPKRH